MGKESTRIKDVDVYDVIKGTKRSSVNVLIREGRFCGIAEDTGEAVPEDVVIVDGKGLTMIPGLIDAHVHIGMEPEESVEEMVSKSPAELAVDAMVHMRSLLENGVACVRSMGDIHGVDFAMAKAVKAGKLQGPDVIPAGLLICMTGGHGWQFGFEADGCDEIRKAVRANIKNGAKCIKLISTGGVLTQNVSTDSTQLSLEELRAGVEEANHAGLRTASHAQGRNGIFNAVKAGISSIEHGFELDDEIVDMMLEKGTYYVPTIAAIKGILDNGSRIEPWMIDKTRNAAKNHSRSIKLAIERGVKIALGTDSGTPFNYFGTSARNEYVDLIEHGMEPMEALRAATIYAAELLGVEEDHGSIDLGKKADFLLFPSDPVKNPEAMRGEMTAYKGGVPVSV